MAIWVVRAGKRGEREQQALDNGLVAMGWNELSDLSGMQSKKDLRALYQSKYPEAPAGKTNNHLAQLWAFVKLMKEGDLVALPLKNQAGIALGTIASAYQFLSDKPDYRHVRRVQWLKTVPRSDFDQDLLYSLGSLSTVFQVKRNEADKRVRLMLQNKVVTPPIEEGETVVEDDGEIDIEEAARDQITKRVDAKFKGHGLATIVGAVLNAQGYVTEVSPPGPDGGIDILAASGPLGFSNPRVCVQVKATSSQVDARILRELQGKMQQMGADQGLLVSWGGFNQACLKEAKASFFRVRLWDQGDLLNEILAHYDRFPDDLKAELPLKRVWALVQEDAP